MTLQASGPMSGADIRGEMRIAGNLDVTGPYLRFLSDKAAAPVTWPTDFYSKAGVRLVDARGFGSASLYSFTGNFGIDYPGRTIFVVAGFYHTGLLDMRPVALSIGGTIVSNTPSGGNSTPTDSGAGTFGAGGSLAFVSGQLSPSGTSGGVAVSLGSAADAGAFYIFSISNAALGSTASGNSIGSTGMTLPVNVPNNGIVFGVSGKTNPNTTAMTGVTKVVDQAIGGGNISVGWFNRLAAVNQPVGFSSAGVADCLLLVRSFG